MIRLVRARHLVEASHLKNLLDSAGIPTLLRNEHLVRLAGEVPFDQCWPELWVENPRDLERARALLATLKREAAHHPPAWTCRHCDEWLEGQFTACWHCGAQKPQD
jgi:Putative prokaryotic signal transducing protein